MTSEQQKQKIEELAARLSALRPEYALSEKPDPHDRIGYHADIFGYVCVAGQRQNFHMNTTGETLTFCVQISPTWKDPFGRHEAANLKLYGATNGMLAVGWKGEPKYTKFYLSCSYGSAGITDIKLLALDQLVRHFVPLLIRCFEEEERGGPNPEAAVNLVDRERQRPEICDLLAQLDPPHRPSIARPVRQSSPPETRADKDDMHEQGIRCFRSGDFSGAIRILRKLCDDAHAPSQYELGLLFLNGNYVERDVTTALKLLSDAARSGHADAQQTMGVIYRDGLCGRVDLKECVRWFEAAARQNNVDACNSLGLRYRNGEGVQEDQARAFELFSRAAAVGNLDAKVNLAIQYGAGAGCRKDVAQFQRLLREAAESGNQTAQQILRESNRGSLAAGIVPILQQRRTDSA